MCIFYGLCMSVYVWLFLCLGLLDVLVLFVLIHCAASIAIFISLLYKPVSLCSHNIKWNCNNTIRRRQWSFAPPLSTHKFSRDHCFALYSTITGCFCSSRIVTYGQKYSALTSPSRTQADIWAALFLWPRPSPFLPGQNTCVHMLSESPECLHTSFLSFNTQRTHNCCENSKFSFQNRPGIENKDKSLLSFN